MNLSFYATALATMGLMPFTTSQNDVCFNPLGFPVGTSGPQKLLQNSSDITLFERKGGDQCECSYVSYILCISSINPTDICLRSKHWERETSLLLFG